MNEKRRCRRVAERPDPQMWDWDELLTLPEAAELLFPNGPLTVSSLRGEVRTGRLLISVVANKHFTTRRQMRRLSDCERLSPSGEAAPGGSKSMNADEARTFLKGVQ
jgi:hypothetical protein